MSAIETTDQTPKFGRVFDAAVSADWAITEEGFRTVLEVVSRTNGQQAVEAYKSEHLQYTQTVKVRNGVAILPITGPISRYTSWLSYYSGGTSISVLARDFQAALDDPNVYSIMFEINSPGGEVTGVNEFAQMVYQARSKKPITARIGGYGCSAAYWIAAMCGDRVIDKTAIVGSIGVMAVYMDDRKQLEMRGLSEIEFISSQSPYKNAAPFTVEGKNRIQKRVDDICEVFVDSVAIGCGVSKKTVLSKFGQGGVFVGQAAIDAGLADRFGSYEETIRLLAKTHTPGFEDAGPDEEPFPDGPMPDDDEDDYAAQKTINNSAAVKFVSEIKQVDFNPADNTENSGELMKTENLTDPNAITDPAPAANDGGSPSPAPAAAPAASAAAPAKETAGASSDEVAALKQQLADANERAEKANERIAALEASATDKWIDDQVKEIGGEVATTKTVLTSLVSAYGQDSAEVKAYIEQQKAHTAQIEASGLFGETGRSGADSDENSAEAKLDKLAKDRVTASAGTNNKLSYEQAYTAVLSENPELAAEVV